MADEISVIAEYEFTMWPKYQSDEYYKNPYRVCRYVKHVNGKREPIVVKGNDLCETPKIPITLYGHMEEKQGKQALVVTSWVMEKPATKEGFINYMSSLKCGVGKARATKIFNHFGENSWYVIENSPERLLEVGLKQTDYKRICQALEKNQMQGKLMSLLRGTNVTYTQVNKLVQQFGSETLNLMQANPYVACKCEGFSFGMIDRLARQQGRNPTEMPRLMAAVVEVLNAVALEGHVCYPRYPLPGMNEQNGLIHKVHRLVSANLPANTVSLEMCDAAITNAVAEKMVAITAGFVYTIERYKEEVTLAETLVQLKKTSEKPFDEKTLNQVVTEYEQETGIIMADCQKEAVFTAMNNQVCIMTGGPGTGKSTTAKAILYAHKKLYQESSPDLLSPTGKAARRLSESTEMAASTIHSALQLGCANDENGEPGAVDLHGNIIIVDESSMMDQHVAYHLVQAVQQGSKLIFVGDPDQLPSVGCGNVLYELLRSQAIPTVKLSVIFRQAGTNPIVENSLRIQQGRTDLLYSNSFCLLDTQEPDAIFARSANMYLQSVRKYGMDSTTLLCPYRAKSALNVNRFNLYLQGILNPAQEGIRTMKGRTIETETGKKLSIEFRVGDKVMQLKNTDYAQNGDVGYITDIRMAMKEGTPYLVAVVEFNDNGQYIELDAEMIKDLDLAYCSTIHKSQGAEYQNVIMVMSNEHKRMLKRNLFYTGITRAKQNVLIVGQPEAVSAAILDNTMQQRFTLLADRIHHLVKTKK